MDSEATQIALRRAADLAKRSRPGLPTAYVDKIGKAIEAGLLDAATNYLWNLVVQDLREKVESYGTDLFLSVEDGLKYHSERDSVVDRWSDIPDNRLLSGCRKLNILTSMGYRHMLHFASLRNHESAAHPVEEESEVDIHNLCALLSDARRFVLARRTPEPGFDIKGLSTLMESKEFEAVFVEYQSQLVGLPQIHADAALGLIVQKYHGASAEISKNTRIVLPVIWGKASEKARQRVGEKYLKYLVSAELDKRNDIMHLLIMVDGVGSIAIGPREALYRDAASKLIEAHGGWDNFEKEVLPASNLADFGSQSCPTSVLGIFVEAIALSWIGNCYGESRASQPFLRKLVSQFATVHWEALMITIQRSERIQGELQSENPRRRLKSLLQQGGLEGIHSPKLKSRCAALLAAANRREVFEAIG